MRIVEDIATRKKEFHVDNPQEAYSELKALLEDKISFDHVSEEKYYNDVETGKIRTKIETEEVYDEHSVEELEIFVTISESSLKIEIKAMLVAVYSGSGWRDSIVYYGYRALFHRLIGMKNHEEYEEAIKDKVEKILRDVESLMA